MDLTKFYPADEIETLRKTVAQQCTEAEMYMFLSLAKRYGLDPFLHEIFLIRQQGRAQIITTRDGYLKIAHRSPHFKGLQSDVICSKDNFRKSLTGIHHEYGVDRGQIVAAWAIVRRDDFTTYHYAPFHEYYRPESKAWKQYPFAMIKKVAEAMALKRAFAISGMCTTEELGSVQTPIKTIEAMMDWVSQVYPEYLDWRRQKLNEGLNGAILQDFEIQLSLILTDKNPATRLWEKYRAMYVTPELAKQEMQAVVGLMPSAKWGTKQFISLACKLFEQEDIYVRPQEDEKVEEADIVEEEHDEEDNRETRD